MSDCDKNRNFRPAIPTKVDGFIHDSKMEGKVAKLLIKNEIKYLPHRTYDVVMPDASIREYTPDFIFREPQKFKGIRPPILFLDVYGAPQKKHHRWMEAMMYTYDCHGFIASQELISKWWRCGLVKNQSIPIGRPKGD